MADPPTQSEPDWGKRGIGDLRSCALTPSKSYVGSGSGLRINAGEDRSAVERF
jgi:hypothetical protein